MIDISAVRADTTADDVEALAETARQYGCICASTLPCYTRSLVELLNDTPETRVGGNVSFPSGSATTALKVAEARELVQMGCHELDMVINLGMLRSGRSEYAREDIRAVVEAVGGAPVKVILECHYLTDDEIRTACEISIQAGAAFVKTSTGWAPTGATLENITLIKSVVGDAIGIKASGGIRDVPTLKAMVDRGATRFGIGLHSALPILEQSGLHPRRATDS
jgi:deoxyribose-phosphate aldolase